MAKSVTVTLAGREYVVAELPFRANVEWRKRLTGMAEDLTTLLEAPGLEFTPATIGAILRQVADLLLRAPDMLVEMLYAYSPEIAADAERIGSEAYESELLGAFIEVLKLGYPFGSQLQSLAGLLIGSAGAPMSPSLPDPSGASGMIGSMKRPRRR